MYHYRSRGQGCIQRRYAHVVCGVRGSDRSCRTAHILNVCSRFPAFSFIILVQHSTFRSDPCISCVCFSWNVCISVSPPYDRIESTVTQKVEALLQRLDMSSGMQTVSQYYSRARLMLFDWGAAPIGAHTTLSFVCYMFVLRCPVGRLPCVCLL